MPELLLWWWQCNLEAASVLETELRKKMYENKNIPHTLAFKSPLSRSFVQKDGLVLTVVAVYGCCAV